MWRAWLVVFVFTLCAQSHAQVACPWLTQGTAATLMGGKVNVVVHVTSGKGTCDFASYANGGSTETAQEGGLHLRIAVGSLLPKECITGERLAGIGEDSVFCTMAVDGEQQEIIRGRVRGTYFLLILKAAKAASTDKVLRRTMLEHIAEEVAGSLF